MKLGSSRGMDTKRPRGSERSKPCHQLRLTRRSQPPYPWPPEQAQPGVSKPCRTTPARPGEDDGRTRPVAGTYDHYALGVAMRTGVREALEAVRPGGRPVMEGGRDIRQNSRRMVLSLSCRGSGGADG